MHEGPEQSRVVLELLLLKNMDFVPVESCRFVQDVRKHDFDMLSNLFNISVSPCSQLSVSLHVSFASSLPCLLPIPVGFLSA